MDENKKDETNDVLLSVPLTTLEQWIDTIDSMEFSLNHLLYVNDDIRKFINEYKTSK